MNKETLNYIICPDCRSDKLSIELFSHNTKEIREGAITCLSCNMWYRIENGILDLLPRELRKIDVYERFAAKNNLEMTFLERKRITKFNKELIEKKKQIDFFNLPNAEDYEKRVEGSTYYQALNEIAFLKWSKKNLRSGDIVIDIGTGTGKICISLAEQNIRTIGIDISEDMVLIAKKKVESFGFNRSVDFILADAENPPFKKNLFDACIFSGTLHHVPDPAMAITNTSGLIMKNGLFFSLDPHNSPLRLLFDILLKAWKIYEEEASDNPLFRESQMKYWLNKSGINCKIKLSSYLPPHVFNLFTKDTCVRLLEISDNILYSIPFIRNFAGVIIIEGIKE